MQLHRHLALWHYEYPNALLQLQRGLRIDPAEPSFYLSMTTTKENTGSDFNFQEAWRKISQG